MIMRTNTLTWNNGYEAAAEIRRITRGNARTNEYDNAVARAKHAAMLVGGPLLGLAAVIALPFVGLGALVWFAIKALPKHVKDVMLFLAAPFIGLAYAIAFPVIGMGMLAWMGGRALVKK
jgi:hypothetical protein